MRQHDYKTLGTSVIYVPMLPPCLPQIVSFISSEATLEVWSVGLSITTLQYYGTRFKTNVISMIKRLSAIHSLKNEHNVTKPRITTFIKATVQDKRTLTFVYKFDAKLREFSLLLKDKLVFQDFIMDYSDFLLKILYLVVLKIIIQKVR